MESGSDFYKERFKYEHGKKHPPFPDRGRCGGIYDLLDENWILTYRFITFRCHIFLLVIISFSIFLTFSLAIWYSMLVVTSYYCTKFILLLPPNKKIKHEEWRGRLKATLKAGRSMRIYVALFAHLVIAFMGGFFLFLVAQVECWMGSLFYCHYYSRHF